MTKSSPTILVRAVGDDARRIKDWLAAPATIYADDPHWVPPLLIAERQRISRKHNPFFKFGEAQFFVAYRDGVPVGRVSGQINRLHLSAYGDATGHFGFFDCIDDPMVAHALLDEVSGYLRHNGMRRMVGPFNLTINQETGLLIDGFDTPPAILSPHSSPEAGRLLETYGFAKAMDLFAYRIPSGAFEKQLRRFGALAKQTPNLTIRPFAMRTYRQELALIFDIFNDAWSENWGFEPFRPEEIEHLVSETRPLMRSKFGRIVEIDGVPVGMMVVLPDINQVTKSFGGRLLPFNWAKLAHAIWRDEWRTARIPLLGIRKHYRGTPAATAILSLLVADFLRLAQDYKLDWIELSWVLETNRPMIALAELAAGKPCKTYRLYEKAL
jgi:hypothetical protein